MTVNENYALIIQALDSVLSAHEKIIAMLECDDHKEAVLMLGNIDSALADIYEVFIASYGDKNAALSLIDNCREKIGDVCSCLQSYNPENEIHIWECIESIKKVLFKTKILTGRAEGIHDEGELETHVYRPKCADEVGIRSDKKALNKTAIVIQGPIKYDDNFTYETVKLYNLLYPECEIILSTWEDETERVKELFTDLKVTLCFSSKPIHAGFGNSAFQTISSKKGIDKAIVLGCERICKTRTDQRFYKPNLFYELDRLLDLFPLKTDTEQKKRIVCISTTTDKNRFYNICDMFVYGDAEDINRYFNCPIDERDYDVHMQMVWTNAVDFAKLRYAEEWFTTHFIESLGYELKWTKEDSDFYRNNLFIIIDASLLDFVWMKYNSDEYKDRYYNSNKQLESKYVGFLEWLSEQDK